MNYLKPKIFTWSTQKGQRSTCHHLQMAALTPIRSTRSALNSRSQEIENQVFLLESMGPANQNFVILSLVIAKDKYVKTLFTSVGLKVHGTNNLKFVILQLLYSLSPGVWQSFVTIRSCNHLMRIISTYVDNTKKSEIS